jgi:hypothetical protein
MALGLDRRREVPCNPPDARFQVKGVAKAYLIICGNECRSEAMRNVVSISMPLQN